jgi:hypothetical protein
MARAELLVTVDKLIVDADLVSPYLSPVVGASVQVDVRATGNPATVYAGDIGGTTVSNPLVTDANGRVNGWVDEGSYVLGISGSGITSYDQPYEAVRGDMSIAIPGDRVLGSSLPGTALTSASVTGSKIANATILGKHLADGALPLGTIIAYWVPSKPGGGYAVPNGWLVCNGQATSAHDFPGGGSITLPNLIDKIPRGTDPSVAYGGAAGMNALVGANTINLAHTHTIGHAHTIAGHSHHVQDHSHYMSHQHGVYVPDHTHGLAITKTVYGGSSTGITITSSNTYGFGGVGVTSDVGNRAYTDGNAGVYTDSQTGGTATSGSDTANSGSGLASTDTRNASVGVLYLIKVKNTV